MRLQVLTLAHNLLGDLEEVRAYERRRAHEHSHLSNAAAARPSLHRGARASAAVSSWLLACLHGWLCACLRLLTEVH